MTSNDLNDMQRYLVEEEAEKWQDGRITRRELLRRVGLIVGGAAAANSVLLLIGCDPNTPAPGPTATSTTATTASSAAATPSSPAGAGDSTPTAGGSSRSPYHVPADSPDVRAEMVDIPSPDPSVKLRGYLAVPVVPQMGMAKPGGVLVIHENRGITPHIEDVVRRLAKANYVALCVDLVSRQGGSAAHPDEAVRTGILGQLTPEQVVSDLSAGLDYLKSGGNANPDRLGVVGFCFGGGYAWRMATKRPDLKAAVAFYGPNPPLEDVQNIKAAVFGVYGERDQRITSKVPGLEDALQKAKVTFQVKVYGGAEHAFHNDTSPRYNPDAAKDAWEKMLEWFRQHM